MRSARHLLHFVADVELNDSLFDDLAEKIGDLAIKPAKHPQERWVEIKESLGPRWSRMREGGEDVDQNVR